MPIKAELDAIDWKILRELQEDGRITNVDLSQRGRHLAPPCLRRVATSGTGRHHQGLSRASGRPLARHGSGGLLQVGLHHQAESELMAFADRTRGWKIVREAWMVSGDSDFMLYCVAPDLATFPELRHRAVTSAPNVDTVRTALTNRQVKSEGPSPSTDGVRSVRSAFRKNHDIGLTVDLRKSHVAAGVEEGRFAAPCPRPRLRMDSTMAMVARQALRDAREDRILRALDVADQADRRRVNQSADKVPRASRPEPRPQCRGAACPRSCWNGYPRPRRAWRLAPS